MSIQTNRMKAITIHHRNLGKALKVLLLNRLLHLLHRSRNHHLCPPLKQLRRLNRNLHPRCTRNTLLLRRHHQNQRPHSRPMRSRRHLYGHRIRPIGLLPHLPRHIPPKQRPTSRSASLSRNTRQLGRTGRQLIQICNGSHERCEPRSGGRKPCCGGEVVLRYDTQWERGQFRQRRILSLESSAQRAQLAKTGLRAGARDVLWLRIEDQGIGGGVRGGAGGGSVCAEVGLRECYGDGGVGWEVEFGVAFSPVSGVGG
ncbi:hypothetical protein ACMFMG_012168 [Clarireedia jacksonii]